MISSKFITVTTAVDGTSFTALPSAQAHFVHVLNNTGEDLAFKYSTDEGTFVLPANTAWTFRGLNNANQLLVKRADESATPVTLSSVEVEL
ncbi:hypothetical protein WJU23_05250 [Prosthecobacter sp. SYSU 5D2]|uniref:hypothetical protein n=1 Tax=Prosthecobacter sp. SYSU 5D2 TaxID=3134134 RepID=UPI0031FF3F19